MSTSSCYSTVSSIFANKKIGENIEGYKAESEWRMSLIKSIYGPECMESVAVSGSEVGAVGRGGNAWVLQDDHWVSVGLLSPATHVTSAPGGRLFFGTSDGRVCAVQPVSHQTECASLPLPEWVTRISVSGDTVLVASSSGSAVVDANTLSVLASVRTKGLLGAMTLTDTEGIVRFANDAGLTYEWSTGDGRISIVSGVPELTAMSEVLWGERGRRFLVGEGRIATLSAYTYGQSRADAEWEGWASSLSATRDLSVVAAITEQGSVTIFDSDITGRLYIDPEIEAGITENILDVNMSSNGRTLSVSYANNKVKIYIIKNDI